MHPSLRSSDYFTRSDSISDAGSSTISARRAFTLVEMMVVMIVILVLTSATVPLIRGLLTNRNVSDGVDALNGYLTYARAQAMAKNTYVAISFYQAQGTDDLQIGSVVSSNGTFAPASFLPYTSLTPTANFPALGNIVLLKNITLVPESQLSSSMLTNLQAANVDSGISDGSIIDCMSSNPDNSSIFSFTIGNSIFGSGATKATFKAPLIVFSPQGEALYFPKSAFPNYPSPQITVSATLPFFSQLFIGLRATRGGNVVQSDQNSAAIMLDGGAGDIKVFRL